MWAGSVLVGSVWVGSVWVGSVWVGSVWGGSVWGVSDVVARVVLLRVAAKGCGDTLRDRPGC